MIPEFGAMLYPPIDNVDDVIALVEAVGEAMEEMMYGEDEMPPYDLMAQLFMDEAYELT